eukprot:1583288-Amphidinium_carterae.1
MTSGEANRWLHVLLLQAKLEPEVTTLSWVAKFGMAREVHQVSGYHSIKGIRSMPHYSRDEQAAPLRQLLRMLREIYCGRFDPEASRSGRFADSALGSSPKGGGEDSGAAVSSDSSASSSSGSDS